MNNKDFTNIKVGDLIIVSSNRNSESLHKVSRVTPTQIIIQYKSGDHSIQEIKYSRSNWRYRIGSGTTWDSEWITIASEEDITRIRNKNKKNILLKKIRSIDFDNLSIEQLEEISNLLSKWDASKSQAEI